MPKLGLHLILKLSVILLVAFALKYHYSTASVDELRWILAPTTFLVEAITGINFDFESRAGYMSTDNTFLIAVSCSGVNFLIIAFLLATLIPIWRSQNLLWRTIPVSMLVAYASALIANTTRIIIAMALQKHDVTFAGFGAGDIHRIEGIVVYFVFLFVLFVAIEKRGALDLKYLLAIYYAVTLGIPLVRGSFLEYDAFWKHFGYVLIIPLAIVIPFLVFRIAKRKLLRSSSRVESQREHIPALS